MRSRRPIAGIVGIAAAIGAGCGGPRTAFPTCEDVGDGLVFAETPTLAEDVAPILNARCVACHDGTGTAPFSLLDPDEVVRWAPAIRAAVVARTMPPPGPTGCGACNRYTNTRWLEPDEIATIRAWADGGAPTGDLAALPPPPPPPAGLDRVDLTVTMPEPYTPDAALADDYRCFVVDPGLDADAFLTAWEGRPGDAREVHHVILYSLAPGAEVAARALDAAAPDAGYSCFGGPGVDGAFSGGWAPGMGATTLPEGTGLKLRAGGVFVLQVHYNLAQGAFPDVTEVDLRLAPEVNVEGRMASYGKWDFRLPPGEPARRVVQDFPAIYPAYPDTITIWGVLPHLHRLGVSLTAETWSAHDGTCLVDQARWDFHSQGLYLYEEPVVVKGTDHLRLTCTYDTRSRDAVTWPGEGTDDEMCVMFLFGTPGTPDAARSAAP